MASAPIKINVIVLQSYYTTIILIIIINCFNELLYYSRTANAYACRAHMYTHIYVFFLDKNIIEILHCYTLRLMMIEYTLFYADLLQC